MEHRKLRQNENWTQRGSACILLFENRISAQRVYVHDTAQTNPNTTIGGGAYTAVHVHWHGNTPPRQTRTHTYTYARVLIGVLKIETISCVCACVCVCGINQNSSNCCSNATDWMQSELKFKEWFRFFKWRRKNKMKGVMSKTYFVRKRGQHFLMWCVICIKCWLCV